MHDEVLRDESRVFFCFDHPCQVVQRGVGVRTLDGLDERVDDVVVLVILLVVAHGGGVDGLF